MRDASCCQAPETWPARDRARRTTASRVRRSAASSMSMEEGALALIPKLSRRRAAPKPTGRTPCGHASRRQRSEASVGVTSAQALGQRGCQSGVGRRRRRAGAPSRQPATPASRLNCAHRRSRRIALPRVSAFRLFIRVRAGRAAASRSARPRPAPPRRHRGRPASAARFTSSLARPRCSEVVAERRVAQRHAHVAQHRASRSDRAASAMIGSFSRQVRQQRVGQAEVAFRVLEVDRVDLVRHGRRADLARAAVAA